MSLYQEPVVTVLMPIKSIGPLNKYSSFRDNKKCTIMWANKKSFLVKSHSKMYNTMKFLGRQLFQEWNTYSLLCMGILHILVHRAFSFISNLCALHMILESTYMYHIGCKNIIICCSRISANQKLKELYSFFVRS